MQSFTTRDGRSLWFGRLDSPHNFSSPTGGAEFALLLAVGDPPIAPELQESWSEQLVRAGCRYAVCFGPTSTTWDDSIDRVNVRDELEGCPSPFVMTTWIDDEPIEAAVSFLAQCTTFDEWVAERFVVLVLGGPTALEHDVLRALREELL